MEQKSLIPKSNAQTIFFSFGTLAFSVVGLVYFDSILKPLVIAFLVWFVINQLKITIEKIKINGKSMPSVINSIIAFLIIFGTIYLVVELLVINIEGLVSSVPEYLANFDTEFKQISKFIRDPKYAEYLQKWIKGLNLAGMATSLVNSLSGLVTNFAVILVYVIFFVMEESAGVLKVDRLFPAKGKEYHRFIENMRNINKSIRFYIWSMTLISFITGLVSYFILLVMGVEYAFLWSFLIFILNFVPYVGPLISSLLPAIFAVLVSGELWQFVYVFAAMEGVQIILGNFVQPKLMGKGSNLSPLTVLVALAFWGMLWGIVGMILAVPIMSVIVIIFSQVPSTRFLAVILSEKGQIDDLQE